MALRRTTAPIAALVVLGLGGAVAGCAQDAPDPGVSVVQGLDRLDAPTFAERMDDPGTVLLDVRTPEEYAAGHLPGAVRVDLVGADAATVDEVVAGLDEDAAYGLYCADGRRSFAAMTLLRARGFEQVFDLEGGTRSWRQYGGTLTRD